MSHNLKFAAGCSIINLPTLASDGLWVEHAETENLEKLNILMNLRKREKTEKTLAFLQPSFPEVGHKAKWFLLSCASLGLKMFSPG